MAFETKIYGNKVRIRGIVDNVTNQQTHYGRMYRLIRSVFFNEPFQFAKGGKNKFAEAEKEGLFKKFMGSLADPMIIMLLVAALVQRRSRYLKP